MAAVRMTCSNRCSRMRRWSTPSFVIVTGHFRAFVAPVDFDLQSHVSHPLQDQLEGIASPWYDRAAEVAEGLCWRIDGTLRGTTCKDGQLMVLYNTTR